MNNTAIYNMVKFWLNVNISLLSFISPFLLQLIEKICNVPTNSIISSLRQHICVHLEKQFSLLQLLAFCDQSLLQRLNLHDEFVLPGVTALEGGSTGTVRLQSAFLSFSVEEKPAFCHLQTSPSVDVDGFPLF